MDALHSIIQKLKKKSTNPVVEISGIDTDLIQNIIPIVYAINTLTEGYNQYNQYLISNDPDIQLQKRDNTFVVTVQNAKTTDVEKYPFNSSSPWIEIHRFKMIEEIKAYIENLLKNKYKLSSTKDIFNRWLYFQLGLPISSIISEYSPYEEPEQVKSTGKYFGDSGNYTIPSNTEGWIVWNDIDNICKIIKKMFDVKSISIINAGIGAGNIPKKCAEYFETVYAFDSIDENIQNVKHNTKSIKQIQCIKGDIKQCVIMSQNVTLFNFINETSESNIVSIISLGLPIKFLIMNYSIDLIEVLTKLEISEYSVWMSHSFYLLYIPNISKFTRSFNSSNQESLSGRQNYRELHNIVKSTLIQKWCTGKRVLDLGAGKFGDGGKYNRIHPKRLTLVEPNPENYAELQRRLSNLPIKKITQTFNLPGQDYDTGEKFDTIAMFFVLTFFYENEKIMDKLIKVIDKHLDQNGVFIGTTFTENGVKEELLEHETINGNFYTIKRVDVQQDRIFGNKISFDFKGSETATFQYEYLVHFQTLIKKLQQCGIYLIYYKQIQSSPYLTKDEDWLSTRYASFVFKKSSVFQQCEMDPVIRTINSLYNTTIQNELYRQSELDGIVMSKKQITGILDELSSFIGSKLRDFITIQDHTIELQCTELDTTVNLDCKQLEDTRDRDLESNVSVVLSKERYFKLSDTYAKLEMPQEEKNQHIFTMCARYKSLIGSTEGSSFHAAVPENVMEYIHSELGIDSECFASPLNAYFNKFCSAFYDVDKYFGSIGSFFDTIIREGKWECNPPFTEEVMVNCAKHIDNMLEQTDKPLMFFVTVPLWDDGKAPHNLEFQKSKFLKDSIILDSKAHEYISGTGYETQSQFLATHKTIIYIIHNSDIIISDRIKYHIKWEFMSKIVVSDFLNFMKSSKDSPDVYTLGDDYYNLDKCEQTPYIYHIDRNIFKSEHWGQRKLFLTELYFLTKYGHLSNIVVYAGAAPGQSKKYLSELFPNHIFYLYDPAPFKVKASETRKLFNQYFTNDTAKEWSGKNVLFITDIRSSNIEDAKSVYEHSVIVEENMKWQEDWINIMKPAMSMIKFRLPWTDSKTHYFDGEIMIQPWAPLRSTETRLITDAKSYRDWDNREYERKCAWHNEIQRNRRYSSIQGCRELWDVAAEVQLFKYYYEHCCKRVPSDKEIIESMHNISKSCDQPNRQPYSMKYKMQTKRALRKYEDSLDE